jgi:hypothetical protein
MYSMWNAPSDRDYYDSLGAGSTYPDEDEAEICQCCGARLDLGEACEEWCMTNQAASEPVPVCLSAIEEQDLTFLSDV